MERPNCSSISKRLGVTPELQWEKNAGLCGVSETASRSGLLANCEPRVDLVEPLYFQQPVAAFVALVPVQDETVGVKEAGLRLNAGWGQTEALQELTRELDPRPKPQHPEWAALPHFTIDNSGHLVSPSTENEQIWGPMPDTQIKNKTLHNKETIACETCHKQFKRLCDYKAHKRSHEDKLFECKQCHKRFSLADNLKKHKLLHSRKTRFTCDVCQKKFTRFSNLKFHKMIHAGEKPFSCDICKMEFKRSGHLRSHLKSHTGEKPYVCELCQKRFSRLNHLKEHTRLHDGKKPYVCDVCSKQFARAGTLNVHKRIHTGHRPFACDVCSKQFTQRVLRDRHKESHA